MKTKKDIKTIDEINEKIRKGDAVIVRADEMPDLFDENPGRAAREVDIVTTGTFGVMCSSGAFLNFGHSDPPIKMSRVWLNEVEAYGGLAAVDTYIGATQISEDKGFEYGGGHVIEDLVAGREIRLRAESYGTDCYPRLGIKTTLTIDDLNQAVLLNPRNNLQKYNAAINSTDTILHTYMGTLLPNRKNVNFAGVGEISPLANDPGYETIGFGTRIFLGGAQGFVIGEGTQHNPECGFGNISVRGNLKEMSDRFLSGASIPGYGASLFVGIGIPIPILNEDIARSTAVRNRDINVEIFDYGVPRRDKPSVGNASYEELFSGKVSVGGKKVKTSPLSSVRISRDIMKELGELISGGEFFLTKPVQSLPKDTKLKNMKQIEGVPFVGDVMSKNVITTHLEDSIVGVSELMIKHWIDQIPITDEKGKLVGIVTSWDVTRALARHKKKLGDIMTKKVITSHKDEYLDVVARRLDKHQVSSTPIVNGENRIVGIITLTDINKILRRR